MKNDLANNLSILNSGLVQYVSTLTKSHIVNHLIHQIDISVHDMVISSSKLVACGSKIQTWMQIGIGALDSVMRFLCIGEFLVLIIHAR